MQSLKILQKLQAPRNAAVFVQKALISVRTSEKPKNKDEEVTGL